MLLAVGVRACQLVLLGVALGLLVGGKPQVAIDRGTWWTPCSPRP